ncbi:unnamed protein product [Polarella glacialis]|uniref:Uncharacterized protein n=1 Tax=Polarella glacialis TaxID=89957 RepID=A0A813FCW6_POLGL|nr:unnamed protein product [Polarella glacialis]
MATSRDGHGRFCRGRRFVACCAAALCLAELGSQLYELTYELPLGLGSCPQSTFCMGGGSRKGCTKSLLAGAGTAGSLEAVTSTRPACTQQVRRKLAVARLAQLGGGSSSTGGGGIRFGILQQSGADSTAPTDLLREALFAADPRNEASFQYLVEDTLQMPVLAKLLASTREVDAIVCVLMPPTDSSQDQDVRRGLQKASLASNVPILCPNASQASLDKLVSAIMNSGRIRREALGIKSNPPGMGFST